LSEAGDRKQAFISHATADRATADAICAALEKAGIRRWIAPRDVHRESSWGTVIGFP
jgi:hypothetical protein